MKFSRDLDMEKHLLDLVLTVRGSGGKGLKKKVWRSIEEAMKARFDRDMEGLSSAVDAADSPEVHGSGDAIGEDGDLQLPPSHEQRAIKVKRLRDGRAKAAAASTAIAVSTDRPLEAFIGACKASEDFFRKRTKQLDSRDSADAIVSNSSESDKQYC
ncbi:hypothetical protein DVH05_014471 [Phytophthora capsici]|nr:hypothetical protein DVH05_014471 [Phytophthora capsici]